MPATFARSALCVPPQDVGKPASREVFNDVYVIYELMDTDLHQIIRSPQSLTDDHFQYFMWQVLVSPGARGMGGGAGPRLPGRRCGCCSA